MNRDDNPRPGFAGHLDDLFARLWSEAGTTKQRTIAARAGISETYLSDVVNRRKTPSADVAERIAAALGAGDADRRSARYYAENARAEPTKRPAEPGVFRIEAFPLATPAVPRADTPFALSHLLSARNRIVPFTGREGERADLAAWSADDRPGVRVRLVHGPGGQGKSRLAAQAALDAADRGRKVGQARHHTDLAPEGPPLRRQAKPALLVVDYAERWPLADLLALVDDLRSDGRPHRVLLLARPAGGWWQSLRLALADREVEAEQHALPPLAGTPDARRAVFRAARDRFAGILGLADPAAVPHPERIDDDSYGLALTLHMAALTAVDARVRGVAAPEEPVELSTYLLARERQFWRSLHELPPGQGNATGPDALAQAVFTAIVTRAMSQRSAAVVLGRVGIASTSEAAGVVLRDHARCYPPSDPANVLEPLYPDRLAEDFLALQTPGHDVGAHTADPWAHGIAEALLGPEDDRLPDYARIGMVTLVEAAKRWPHLVEAQLAPLLRAHPRLALTAGGAALSGLAANPAVGSDVLTAVEALLPPHRHAELDAGACAVVERLTAERLAATDVPVARAGLHQYLGWRLILAHRHEDALAELSAAVDTYRGLESDRAKTRVLADTLEVMGACLGELGRFAEASATLAEAVELWRGLGDGSALAGAQVNLGRSLAGERRWAEAAEVVRDAVGLLRDLVVQDADRHEHTLALALNNLAANLSKLGRADEARESEQEAVVRYRRLAAEDPARHEPELGRTLVNRSRSPLPKREALAAASEAEAIFRRLAELAPVHESMLASALATKSKLMMQLGDAQGAFTVAEEAAALFRRQQPADPAAHAHEFANHLVVFGLQLGWVGEYERQAAVTAEAVACLRAVDLSQEDEELLAGALRQLGMAEAALGRRAEALAASREAVARYQALVAAHERHEPGLADALTDLGMRLAAVEEWNEALEANRYALFLFERLAAVEPDEHASSVARALANVGQALTGLERFAEALAVGQRAAEAFGRLAAAAPRYEVQHATALLNVGGMLHSLGRTREALEVTERALRIRRRLADEDPQLHGPRLAAALNNAAAMSSEAGRVAEALAANEESVALYRKLARLRPAAFEVELARTLYVGAEIRVASGTRVAEALAMADESLEVVTRAMATAPGVAAAIRHNALLTKAQALLASNREDEAMQILIHLQQG